MADLLEQKVEATPFQAAQVFETAGLRRALQALEKLQKEFPALPGVALACMTIRAEESEARRHMMQVALRAAAKGGIDINASDDLFTVPQNDGRVFFITNWADADKKDGA